MPKLRILVADDQTHGRNLMELRLKKCAQGVFTPEIVLAECAEEAVGLTLREGPFDLVLLDIDFRESAASQGMDGHEAATRVRAALPAARVLLVSALGGLEHQIQAHKNPAVDRMLSRSDFTDETLRHICLWSCVGRLHEEGALIEERYRIYTRAPAMLEYLKHLDRIRYDANTVIYGETGTGKELSARRLHANAKFAFGQNDRPFAAFNCGQVSESLIEAKLFGYVQGAFTGADRTTPGLFDVAQDGDLFFDELQNAPIKLQHILMRVLQEKTFTPLGSQKAKPLSVRFIAALNKSLSSMKDDGTLMPDFVARLQQDYIEIPPLRERREDLPLLIATFLARRGAADIRLDVSAMDFLTQLSWKENVRAVERLCVSLATHAKVPTVTAEMLETLPVMRDLIGEGRSTRIDPCVALTSPVSDLAVVSYERAKEDFERGYFLRLARMNQSLRKLSERSGVSRNTLSAKFRQFGIGASAED